MVIIPAIDLRGGRCVRLLQGDYARETVFGHSPLDYARRWCSEGAERLHIVDLDGARTGKPSREHWDIVAEIVRSVPVPVQLGGGIRNLEVARQALAIGVDRVIVGTALVAAEAEAAALFDELGDGVIAGIDARDGKVAVDGWTEGSSWEADDLAAHVETLGARRIVFTDISRDGMRTGPNLASLSAVCGRVRLPVIASGGISSLSDVVALERAAPPNVEAVIVGRALYSGDLSLVEAIAAVSAQAPRCRQGREE